MTNLVNRAKIEQFSAGGTWEIKGVGEKGG